MMTVFPHFGQYAGDQAEVDFVQTGPSRKAQARLTRGYRGRPGNEPPPRPRGVTFGRRRGQPDKRIGRRGN